MSQSFLPQVKSLFDSKPFKGKVALITGSTRGIGKEIAIHFARAGCNVVIVGKSSSSNSNQSSTLPGTVESVSKELSESFPESQFLGISCDVRIQEDLEKVVREVKQKFNRLDFLICNAGALYWEPVKKTPMSRFDLVMQVNCRGHFFLCQQFLPLLQKQGGHVVFMSPPIDLNLLKGKVAYSISKFGMTMIAMGVTEELESEGNRNVALNCVWPATMVESFATKNFKLGDEKLWRKADIIADTTLLVCAENPKSFVSGKAIIDEEYLQMKGVQDFKRYRCHPDFEPPRLTFEGAKNLRAGLVKDAKDINLSWVSTNQDKNNLSKL